MIVANDSCKPVMPSFDSVKSKIKVPLIEEKARELMSAVQDKAKIELVDPAFKGMDVRGSF